MSRAVSSSKSSDSIQEKSSNFELKHVFSTLIKVLSCCEEYAIVFFYPELYVVSTSFRQATY